MHLHSNMTACDHTRTTIALASSDWSRLFDGHMTYDSHVFTSILSVSNVPLLWSDQSRVLAPRGQALFYNFTLCSHSCSPFIFNLQHHHWSPNQLPIRVSPELRFSTYASHCLALILHYFALFCTILHHIALPWSHCLYLPQYTWRQSLTPRSHPLRAP